MRSDSEQQYIDYVTARLPTLRRMAYLLCGDPHRADDLVQQTVTKLYVRWPKLRDVTYLDQYVRTMLLRVFLDERRLPWSRTQLFADPPDTSTTAPPGAEDRMVLRAALAKVPPRQRAVLVLRFLCDLPIDEVATMLGCSSGTPKGR